MASQSLGSGSRPDHSPPGPFGGSIAAMRDAMFSAIDCDFACILSASVGLSDRTSGNISAERAGSVRAASRTRPLISRYCSRGESASPPANTAARAADAPTSLDALAPASPTRSASAPALAPARVTL